MADTILWIRRVGQETAFEPVRREGLSNFETRVMDTRALDLPSDSFDARISRFALMLVPDIDEAHPNSALPKLGNLLDRPKSDISDLGCERGRPKLPHPSKFNLNASCSNHRREWQAAIPFRTRLVRGAQLAKSSAECSI